MKRISFPYSISTQRSLRSQGLPSNVPYFITLGGYLLIFFVEKIAFDTHSFIEEHHHHHHPLPAPGAPVDGGKTPNGVVPSDTAVAAPAGSGQC
jgi:hypothetical protein